MANLKYLFSKTPDETYSINWYDGPQLIENNGYKFVSEPLKGIIDIKEFTDETFGETDEIYFTKYIKYKYGETWSEMIPLKNIIESGLTFSCFNDGTESIINPNEEVIIELYYYISKESNINSQLSVNNIKISGEYIMNITDEIAILNEGDEIVLAPKDIFKIFELEDYVLVSTHTNLDIKYRFTQDNNRTYTEWLPLNKENIASTKLNPLRFASVEYLIQNLGSPVVIYDIILIGDFQNVSANYLKTNKYGLKEDCISGIESNMNSNSDEFISSCSSYSVNAANELDAENKEKNGTYWNPYDFKPITDFANMLGNQVSEIFGWDVDYHIIDPDQNGIDKYIHEYTLKNIVDMKRIKIIVPDNKFPVESVVINQFNLDLFDTFQIHIMKDEFKNKFGITRRPNQDDVLYICEANMLYYVKHAQAFKDIMNSATYYKIILEKYEYKSNIRNINQESKDSIESLTDNTTIESLFGNDIIDTEQQIANKEQFHPTTMDFIRQKVSSKLIYEKENLYIDDFNTVKTIYNLTNKSINGKTAIDYKKSDTLIKSDNRSFMFWFKFENEYTDEGKISNKIFNNYAIARKSTFNFLNNYDKNENLGYDIYYRNNNLYFKLNDMSFSLNEKLLTNIWYIGVINLNQKQQKLDMKIYNRNADINVVYVNPDTYERKLCLLSDTGTTNDLIANGFKPVSNLQSDRNTGLNLINSASHEFLPVEFTISSNLKLLGSNIKYSNMRIFSDVIPEPMIENIIKENIIKESQHLIIADNASKKINVTNFYNKNWK